MQCAGLSVPFAVFHGSGPCSLVLYSTGPCYQVEYNTVEYSRVEYRSLALLPRPLQPLRGGQQGGEGGGMPVQYSIRQYITVQYTTVHYITVQYSTVQYSTVLEY